MQHRKPAESQEGAFHHNTTCDIIRNLQQKLVLQFKSRCTFKYLKVKQRRRKYDFDVKENESSIVQRN